MTLYRSYQKAERCTGGPTPGAKALMAWFLGRWGNVGGKNLGIYNCRSVRGGTTTSLHGEGRACDFGINPHGAQYGDQIAEMLRSKSAELGVQCVIWRKQIWSGAKPDAGWRHYSGTNPHLDHIHVELSRTAAQTLTPQAIDRVFAVAAVVVPAKTPPVPLAPRPREDAPMLIKTQPDKTKPVVLTALLQGPFFIGLGALETPSDEQARAMGMPIMWVEYGTWQDLDRRSRIICENPRGVNVTNMPTQNAPSK